MAAPWRKVRRIVFRDGQRCDLLECGHLKGPPEHYPHPLSDNQNDGSIRKCPECSKKRLFQTTPEQDAEIEQFNLSNRGPEAVQYLLRQGFTIRDAAAIVRTKWKNPWKNQIKEGANVDDSAT